MRFVGISRNCLNRILLSWKLWQIHLKKISRKDPLRLLQRALFFTDADTGKVLPSTGSNMRNCRWLPVTKAMTMLLVMDAVDSGKITLEDEVTISERAASMGGSRMYMEFEKLIL